MWLWTSGCVETTHPTTHADPIYVVDGIVHYAVANMPGAVARTSTFALNNGPCAGADDRQPGLGRLHRGGPWLCVRVNVANGRITYEAVARRTARLPARLIRARARRAELLSVLRLEHLDAVPKITDKTMRLLSQLLEVSLVQTLQEPQRDGQ